MTEGSPPTQKELRSLYGEPRDLVREAWSPRLDDASTQWLRSCTLLLLCSVNGDGDIDITPRGGEPGFIHIQDDRNIAFLDDRGNNKIHTLMNLAARPAVGMMFMIPGQGEVVRAYGTASIGIEAEMIRELGGSADKNRSAISINLHKIFPHCSKAFARAGVWDCDRWPQRKEAGLPSLSELAKGMAAARTGE